MCQVNAVLLCSFHSVTMNNRKRAVFSKYPFLIKEKMKITVWLHATWLPWMCDNHILHDNNPASVLYSMKVFTLLVILSVSDQYHAVSLESRISLLFWKRTTWNNFPISHDDFLYHSSRFLPLRSTVYCQASVTYFNTWVMTIFISMISSMMCDSPNGK